ncbi:Peptidoglycan-binding protein ArfA [Streptomyces sp. YIM 130001]|uniref:OmpA family protein n=1 Tax=Streptomyces sp. YIM 130001 TaxID=2259644 RepID=UPI000E652511|nr:OmpA family protein [Streptomyces sp. YIM 130001]RII20712.1 Peptidoglycan-binding protein ArfA [Streptomyces sp. YIM 130001]
MHHSLTRRRQGRVAATTVTAVALLATLSISTAQADDEPSQPPGSTTSQPPPKVDGNSPGLKLSDGATLAPAKVLDVKSVIEDLGGEERREDTGSDVKFALQAEVLFGKDSAKLNPKANARIKEIADEVEAQGAKKVRVFGFTDNLGSYAHGKKLSKERADAVHDQLSKTLGSDITFEVRGYSEDYPIASNSTEEGRKKNRRVEVAFPRGEADAGSQS